MKFLAFLFAMATVSLGEQHKLRGRDLKEEQDNKCGRNSAFTAHVLVEHEMQGDPHKLEYDDIRAITEGFQVIYNALNFHRQFEACDEISKRFSHVPVIHPKDVFYERFNKDESIDLLARRNILYAVTVSGVNVSDETRMFHITPESESTRQLEAKTEDANNELETGTEDESRELNSISALTDVLQYAENQVCKCDSKLKAGAYEQRAPTALEFKQVFNDFITYQQTQLKTLKNIGKIVHITELEPVDCKPEIIKYKTTIEVDVNATEVGQWKEKQIATDLMDSYNDYASFFCDPCFNVVTGVKFTNSISLPPSRRNRDAPSNTRLRLQVKGKCRKKRICKKTKKLFSNARNRRALLPLGPVSGPDRRFGRRLTVENQCFCPVQPYQDRAPSTQEFLSTFNEIVQETTDLQVINVNERGS